MKEYHKIQSIYLRDDDGVFIPGEWSKPEFEYLKDLQWIWTEKVDGTNTRVIYEPSLSNSKISFKGKTDESQIYVRLLERLNDLFNQENMIEIFKEQKGSIIFPLTLYGEGFGRKIQKGGGNYNPDGVDFVLFDVFIGGLWLKRESIERISSNLNIQIVPIVGKGTLSEAIEFTKSGFKSHWGDFIAEGLVLRPEIDLQTRRGERIITKVKHKDFIIKTKGKRNDRRTFKETSDIASPSS